MKDFDLTNKETWHRILKRDMINDGEKFDELTILSARMVSRVVKQGTKKELHLRYKTEYGSGTSFGNAEVAVEDIPAIFREDKINQIIE